MAAPIIRIDNITKRYGALTVLDGLSMEVLPGEKLALIGPSGSGKTTILRILMTLETISDGHIEVDGDQLYHMPGNGGLVPADDRHLHRMREKIGMVFQHFNLFPHKCVLDNVTLAPMLTTPWSGWVAPATSFSSVDLPAPLAPSTHQRSLRRTRKSRPS